jgi:microcystin degradation protein MlrC
MDGEFLPTVGYRKIPLLTPCEGFQTAKPPLKDWFDMARELEGRPGVIDVSLFPVTPWFDEPETGWSVVVTTNNDRTLADACAAELADFAWERRRAFYFKKYEPAEAVRIAAAHPDGPVVLADGADATNGGSPGDSTCLLREMLAQRITCTALLTIVDPEAVRLAYAAGVGATVELKLGAKRSRRFHQPVRAPFQIARFSDGQFTIGGHGAAKVNMGRCALLEIGTIKIVVSEFAGPGHDPAVFRQIGLEPREAQIVVVKATVGHMDVYRDIMKLNLPVECPGPSPSYLERLDYRRIPRSMFPFDPDMAWKASV